MGISRRRLGAKLWPAKERRIPIETGFCLVGKFEQVSNSGSIMSIEVLGTIIGASSGLGIVVVILSIIALFLKPILGHNLGNFCQRCSRGRSRIFPLGAEGVVPDLAKGGSPRLRPTTQTGQGFGHYRRPPVRGYWLAIFHLKTRDKSALAQRVIRGYLLSTNVRMFDGSQMIL